MSQAVDATQNGQPAMEVNVTISGPDFLKRDLRFDYGDGRHDEILDAVKDERANGERRLTYRINDHRPAEISEIRLQSRPFDQWIKFRNVSLNAGEAMQVQVVTSDGASPK